MEWWQVALALAFVAFCASLGAWVDWAAPKSDRKLEKESRALDRAAGPCGKTVGRGRGGVYECDRPYGHEGKHGKEWAL